MRRMVHKRDDGMWQFTFRFRDTDLHTRVENYQEQQLGSRSLCILNLIKEGLEAATGNGDSSCDGQVFVNQDAFEKTTLATSDGELVEKFNQFRDESGIGSEQDALEYLISCGLDAQQTDETTQAG